MIYYLQMRKPFIHQLSYAFTNFLDLGGYEGSRNSLLVIKFATTCTVPFSWCNLKG